MGNYSEEVPLGQNYHYFTSKMSYPNPIFAWRSRFSDFLYKAHPDEPVRTVVAKLGKYSGPFHWKNRRFTVAEMKRLQGFPDDYVLAGTEALQMQQIGNSVPPTFAKQLALSVLKSLYNQNVNVDLISEDFEFSFDKQKGHRAKKTRGKTQNYPLFDFPEEVSQESKQSKSKKASSNKQSRVVYPTPKTRQELNDVGNEDTNAFVINVATQK